MQANRELSIVRTRELLAFF